MKENRMQTNGMAVAALVLLTGMASACGGDRADDGQRTETTAAPAAQATTVTGCIKGGDAAGSYVFVAEPTMLGAAVDRRTRGQVTTYTYVLTGQNLEPYVGRQVSVTGRIEGQDNVEVEKSRELSGEPTTTDDGTVTPTVEIEETALIETRTMQVESVQATGQPCVVAEPPPS
jgi:hypothetical protein